MTDYRQTRDAAGKVTTQYDKMLRNLDDDLVKRLAIMAGVIEMGEKIAWGSDTALMREAATRIEELEAKLEKIVAMALEECPFREGTGSYNDWWHDRRTTLAELKGQNHE